MYARKSLLSLAIVFAVSGAAMADSSTVNTSQAGSDNKLAVDQQGATQSTVTVNQNGGRNTAGSSLNGGTPVSQRATYSNLTINQTGYSNTAGAKQAGNNNTGSITQNAGGPQPQIASLDQSGGYSKATIDQQGN